MNVTSASHDSAALTMTRAEVLAIRNAAENAGLLHLEARGPSAIFERLAAEFGALAKQMNRL